DPVGPTRRHSGLFRLEGHWPIAHDWLMLSQANGSPSADELASVLAGWTESAHGALSRRLANAIRGAVASGLIGDQVRLPAERALAQSLGVSRSTVTVALDELRADRIVESRQGSGTVVHGP